MPRWIRRVTALHLYLRDLYHEQPSLRQKRLPGELVFSARHFRRRPPPRGLVTGLARETRLVARTLTAL